MADADGDRRGRSEATELLVRYDRINAFFAEYVKNLASGETFVATREPLPPGTDFELALGVPTLSESLRLRARVTRTTWPSEATPAQPAGMGIEFRYRSEQERSRLRSRVEALMLDQLGERHTDALLGR